MRTKYVICIDREIGARYAEPEDRAQLLAEVRDLLFSPIPIVALPAGVYLSELLLPDLPPPPRPQSNDDYTAAEILPTFEVKHSE